MSTVSAFVYYLRRHIECDGDSDGDSHGLAASQLVEYLIQSDPAFADTRFVAGENAIKHRIERWNSIQAHIVTNDMIAVAEKIWLGEGVPE